MNARASAFSLIEMLVVLALILIFTAMFFGFSSPSHQKTQQRNCEANLLKIQIAMEIYANENSQRFPVASNAFTSERPMEMLVPRYSADTTIFLCPGSEHKPLVSDEPLSKQKISYAYYMGLRSGGTPVPLMSDAQINTNAKAGGDAVFSNTGKPPGNNHHKFGGNVLFSDGHVELSKAKLEFPLPIPPGTVLLNPKPQ